MCTAGSLSVLPYSLPYLYPATYCSELQSYNANCHTFSSSASARSFILHISERSAPYRKTRRQDRQHLGSRAIPKGIIYMVQSRQARHARDCLNEGREAGSRRAHDLPTKNVPKSCMPAYTHPASARSLGRHIDVPSSRRLAQRGAAHLQWQSCPSSYHHRSSSELLRASIFQDLPPGILL
ncbi:hypothetical protein BV20DRAFT_416996 [Pilatotrama ljubarskyi]|nr:hypothetical protein BV20DRAFT_416996 [Pilatotrama ljubarskyi]